MNQADLEILWPNPQAYIQNALHSCDLIEQSIQDPQEDSRLRVKANVDHLIGVLAHTFFAPLITAEQEAAMRASISAGERFLNS
mgnify:FL=1|jgi:hypothetical protein